MSDKRIGVPASPSELPLMADVAWHRRERHRYKGKIGGGFSWADLETLLSYRETSEEAIADIRENQALTVFFVSPPLDFPYYLGDPQVFREKMPKPRFREYERTLAREVEGLRSRIDALENDSRRQHAHEARELLSAVMDDDWRGLEILSCLKSSGPAAGSEIASHVNRSIDDVAPILARLVRFGGATIADDRFEVTRRGDRLIEELEKNTGVSLAFGDR